jgi:ABC-type phosphate/phosphonate transport system substrate-binding protein
MEEHIKLVSGYICHVVIGALCFAAVFCLSVPAAVQAAETEQSKYRIGFSNKSFVHIPKEDMQVAVNVMTRKIASKNDAIGEAKIYTSREEIEKDLRNARVDVLALTADEYLQYRALKLMEPEFLHVYGNSHEMELLILVGSENAAASFADLKRKTVVLPSLNSQGGATLHTWLDTLVMKQGGGSLSSYFSNVSETRSSSQAIMHVFFNKTDACVVTRRFFDLASEMNPQISKKLRHIAQIRNLVGGIIVFRKSLPESRKQEVRNVLANLHKDPDGKQMFTLFQISRLEPYRPEYLKNIENLHAEHRRLKMQGSK